MEKAGQALYALVPGGLWLMWQDIAEDRASHASHLGACWAAAFHSETRADRICIPEEVPGGATAPGTTLGRGPLQFLPLHVYLHDTETRSFGGSIHVRKQMKNVSVNR